MLQLKERNFPKEIVQFSRKRQLNRDWGAHSTAKFRCATLVWISIVVRRWISIVVRRWISVVVRRVNLRLELVEKCHKAAIILLEDQSSILPCSVFSVMSTSDRTALVLMNVVNTTRTAAMSAAAG